MKKPKHTTVIILLIVSFLLTITGCGDESRTGDHYNYNYNYNDYSETTSDKKLVESAIYNNADKFASKAKVQGVGTIVIASCSKNSGNTWRVKGHFYGKDSYGHTIGVYNFTCDVSVNDGYTSIFRCVVEEDY